MLTHGFEHQETFIVKNFNCDSRNIMFSHKILHVPNVFQSLTTLKYYFSCLARTTHKNIQNLHHEQYYVLSSATNYNIESRGGAITCNFSFLVNNTRGRGTNVLWHPPLFETIGKVSRGRGNKVRGCSGRVYLTKNVKPHTLHRSLTQSVCAGNPYTKTVASRRPRLS